MADNADICADIWQKYIFCCGACSCRGHPFLERVSPGGSCGLSEARFKKKKKNVFLVGFRFPAGDLIIPAAGTNAGTHDRTRNANKKLL